ncbi:DUF1877 family protein [Novosphingobium soli]|uniref:DUF1877 family protein n=1 Tax=Novosphingobium soli TaxID=574956 RepID=A0ABV6CTW5_9SPHN
MGITFSLIRVPADTVAALAGRPRAVAEFVYQDGSFYKAPKPGFFGRFFGAKAEATDPIPARHDNDEMDLDKSWHIVHYLLTGSTGRSESPLGIIGDDLHPLANLDLGLGKPNVLSPDVVAAFDQAAQSLTDDAVMARFIATEMPTDELYLGNVIARGDEEDMREYALENFHVLRDFARQAAAANEAIITFYS